MILNGDFKVVNCILLHQKLTMSLIISNQMVIMCHIVTLWRIFVASSTKIVWNLYKMLIIESKSWSAKKLLYNRSEKYMMQLIIHKLSAIKSLKRILLMNLFGVGIISSQDMKLELKNLLHIFRIFLLLFQEMIISNIYSWVSFIYESLF